jgi:AcrR family transcriptional regulator
MGRRGPKPIKAESIARAALALFVERGVKGATTRAIARRANTTEASLYRHYEDKDDLARRVLYDCLKSFGERMEGALEGAVGPRQRLRAFVGAYIEFASECPLEHSFILQAQVGNSNGPNEIQQSRQILSSILIEGEAAGEFSTASTRLFATFVL